MFLAYLDHHNLSALLPSNWVIIINEILHAHNRLGVCRWSWLTIVLSCWGLDRSRRFKLGQCQCRQSCCSFGGRYIRLITKNWSLNRVGNNHHYFINLVNAFITINKVVRIEASSCNLEYSNHNALQLLHSHKAVDVLKYLTLVYGVYLINIVAQ